MKLKLITLITVTAATLVFINDLSAQKLSRRNLELHQINEVSISNYKEFKSSVTPLVGMMKTKRIVGLGEGTHGTAEFYKLRFWLSRILIEEHGFNHIAFENDLGDTWSLNNKLNTKAILDSLMKNHIMSIWQNQETREMLQWIRDYNKKRKKKITVSGIDYPLLKPEIDALLSLLSKTNDQDLHSAINGLLKSASLQDDAWLGKIHKSYKEDMNVVRKGSKAGYKIADSIELVLQNANIDSQIKNDCLLLIANLKQGFEPFNKMVPEGARDSIMAHNAFSILKSPNDKMIIWAHNAHLGKTGIYNNAVGGTGGYLLKLFPDNYFVLGTGTSTGTFAGTTDPKPHNNNPMNAYGLEKPIKGSWEELFSSKPPAAYFFDPKVLNSSNQIKPLRFIGFGTKSGTSSYDQTNLIDLFDAFLFIKQTHAPTPLQETGR